ncbi:hypothetical protein GCM10022393_17930 [Aquimarina addita]|uniref:Uncharacterized protein n=1 Tax=Aquimarina addita TaxID=870485 RepID=A0ABP6UJV6_9FLAO
MRFFAAIHNDLNVLNVVRAISSNLKDIALRFFQEDSQISVGDIIKVVNITLDREKRKMSLGVKRLNSDPWIDITSKYPV